MYTQFQRFIATILLFSILLQSCSQPSMKLVEPLGASGETNKPQQHTPTQLLQKQEDTREEVTEIASTTFAERSPEALAVVSSEAAYTKPKPRSRKVNGERCSASSPTSARSRGVPSSSPGQASRSSAGSKKSLKHMAHKTQHGVLGKAVVAKRIHQKEVPMSPNSKQAGPSSSTTQPTWSLQGTAQPPQNGAQPNAINTAPEASSCAVSSSPLAPTYPSAQGHQVRFENQAGTWQAQVQDVWGRLEVLPVVCAPDQTPERSHTQLAHKAPGQHKYWVHVLETDQPPWSPKVVYIGALGLRGGGNDLTIAATKKASTLIGKDCVYSCSVETKDNSDDESDGHVRSSGYTFYRSSCGYWRTTCGYDLRSYNTRRLSANDIRASSFRFHCCTASVHWSNCVALDTPYSHITAQRERRREERRKRREAQRRQEEARRQEAARRQEEERKRQEAERKRQEEARRREEEERKRQEEARRKEEERKRQEEAAAKIAAERHALAQKIGAEAAETAKTSLEQFWHESPTIKKQKEQMKKALKRLSAPQATQRAYTQAYVGGAPALGTIDPYDPYEDGDEEASVADASLSRATPLEEEKTTPVGLENIAEETSESSGSTVIGSNSVASVVVPNTDKDTTPRAWPYDNDAQTNSETSSVYSSAVASLEVEEEFASACASVADLSDTEVDLSPLWSHDVLAHAALGWGQVEDAQDSASADGQSTPVGAAQVAPFKAAVSPSQGAPWEAADAQPQVVQGSQPPARPALSTTSFHPLKTLRHVARAITVPFDHRPLASLVQAVNKVCIQLNQGALGTEQLDTSIAKGKEVMRSLEQQQYTPTLDWHERVHRKTLAEKLSCHVRLYQRLAYWSRSFIDKERTAFEVTILPILKRDFLRANTEVQQALHTYWENGGHCYTDIMQDAAVSDWLRQSLFRDITQEVTNNKLVHDQFAQRLEALVLHKEGLAQKKLLNKLLWALRARQQAQQFDLLAVCRLLAWLPTDGEQALQLLNNGSSDWYEILKVHWILPRLEVFEDRYQKEEISELCVLLSRLPCDKVITDNLLQAVRAEQDYTALKDLLLFLGKYPIEDDTLLEIFHTPLPEEMETPCRWLHHTLACKLLHEPLEALFAQEKEALHRHITAWLQTHLGAYDALYAFINALQANEVSTQVRSKQALQLREVLSLLSDYGAAAEVCTNIFQAITDQPASQWEATAHQLVVAATFQASYELSTQEIIEHIVKHAPDIFSAGDAQQLQHSYDATLAAYQGHASMLRQAQEPIAQWSQENIKVWTQAVKHHYSQEGPKKFIPQGELLAVLRRAVELHEGFSPRDTQLLSVLVLALLQSPAKKGRLAQIITGEGKSLIVAMLAAIHALHGQKVDVLTTSIELSIPEVEKKKPFFDMFGLTVGENSKKNATADKERHAIYQKDIVYGTAEDFQADIISTEFFRKNIRGDRGFGVVLVDEVDSMLFDDRNHSTQLAGLTPAMNHLEIVLGAIWNQVNQIASRLRTIDGQCYFIKAAKFKDVPGGVVLPEGKTLASCSELVEDQLVYLKKHTAAHLETLLRKLTAEEREKLEAYKAQERRAEQLHDKSLTAQYEAALEALEQEPWSQEEEYLEIPAHLQDFARKQIPHWVENAIHALLAYQKEQHYHVKGNKIVTIDYSNTGVLQYNTVWENGLMQFLQIKEGLKVTPEGIATNFLSKPGYFKRYENRLYGLTGTLGNETTRDFLADVYGVDMVTIPPYKHREIAGNEASRYRCKELMPKLVATSAAWYDAITKSVIRPARNGQAVLVICQYINQVAQLKKMLATNYDARKLFTYTGEEDFTKHQIDAGEIILATNIAGRGTDLNTSQAVGDCGGLHVCITFLPKSYRVELQNAGRTARQGKKGSAQLVLRIAGEETLQDLRIQRNEKEAQAIEQAKQDVARMMTADRLFMRYCGLEASFFPTMEALQKAHLSQELIAQWQVFAEEALSTDAMQASYEEHIQKRLANELAQRENKLLKRAASIVQTMQAVGTYSKAARQAEQDKLAQEIKAALMQSCSLEAFRKQKEEETRATFIQEAQSQQEIPADVLVAFLNNQVYVPSGAELANQYGWTEAERHGSQERWGIWLKADNTAEDQERTARLRRFDGFESMLKTNAQRDQLIHNPYYYVHKGNEFLQRGAYHAAIRAYSRGIALDPSYSANARFNMARALVYPAENQHNHATAKRELAEAQHLIKQQKNILLSFDTLVGQTGKKPRTSEHVQHQLDILSQQENYIQAAIDVIESAQQKGWHVEITKVKSIQTVFKEAEGNRQQALEEATVNGFTHVFTIKEKEPPKPKRWWSIIAVALIGVAQVVAGVFVTACTLGVGMTLGKGLISEGVSDLITAVKAGIQGGFSWAEWALQKAISLAVSLISAGWDAIEKGCTAVKEAVQNVDKATTEVGKSVVQEAAQNVGKATTKITATEMRKKGMKVALQRVGSELGKGVAKECANVLANYGVDQLLIENIEKEIEERVSEKVNQSLMQSSLVQDALALDVENDDNHWQNLLLQAGMELLAVKKDDKVLYALKEVAKGVASNKIPGAKAALQSAAMLNALNEVMTLTDSFLADFHRKVEKNYKKEIEKAAKENQAIEQKQQVVEHQQVSQQVSAPPPPIDEANLEVPLVTIREDYKSELRNYYYEAPSNVNNLCGSFSSAITHRITNKIQGDIIRPATGALVNMGIDKMLAGVEETVKRNEDDFCIEGAPYYYANKMGNESRKDRKKKKGGAHAQQESEEQGKASSDHAPSPPAEETQRAAKPIHPANKEMADQVRAGAEGSIVEAGAASTELKRPIALYDEHGRLLEIVGRKHKGSLLSVQHIPSADGLSGHFIPYGTQATASASGNNNCLYDALACQVDRVKSGAELRERVANRIEKSAHTPALYRAAEQLAAYNPRAMRRGGWAMAEMYMMREDPHSFYNRLFTSSNKAYQKLEKEQRIADQCGDTEKSKKIAQQLRKIEIEAFEARREREQQMARYILQWGAGAGAAVAAAPLGPITAYAAGAGTFSGVGIALDPEIRANIKAGDWPGFLDHSSYHLPFVGSGRHSWEAWHAGNYLGAAGYAGLFGLEAVGVRAAGKVRWGQIRPAKNAYELAKAGGKHAKFYKDYVNITDKSLRKGIRSFQQQIEKHENLIKDPKKYLEVYGKTKDYPPWDQLHPDQRISLLEQKWPAEIKKFKEQKAILEDILKDRKR